MQRFVIILVDCLNCPVGNKLRENYFLFIKIFKPVCSVVYDPFIVLDLFRYMSTELQRFVFDLLNFL